MRSNRKIIFGLILILGAFGFYRAFQWFSSLGRTPVRAASANTSTGQGDPNLRPVALKTTPGRVVQARVNIPANSIVTPDMLQLSDKPLPSTKGYATDIESQGAGFITRVPIGAGDNIMPDNDFVGHVSQTGIAGLLQPGTRAMVVPIANKPTLHDLVRIGNRIDVLAAFDGQESRSLLQDVRVLGVDVSANDYPNVSAAMRGPFKADAKRNGPRSADTSAPDATPTPAPGAARPDPALVLEVLPRQAAQLQLALASNATLDFLVRPAVAGNRSSEAAPVGNNPDGTPGTIDAQTVSVIKPQIAPYAERKKAGGGNAGGANAGARGSANGSGDNAPRLPRGGRVPTLVNEPNFPASGGGGAPVIGPATLPNPVSLPPRTKPVPTPTRNYTIPVYGDGKILRNETVPLPDPSR